MVSINVNSTMDTNGMKKVNFLGVGSHISKFKTGLLKATQELEQTFRIRKFVCYMMSKSISRSGTTRKLLSSKSSSFSSTRSNNDNNNNNNIQEGEEEKKKEEEEEEVKTQEEISKIDEEDDTRREEKKSSIEPGSESIQLSPSSEQNASHQHSVSTFHVRDSHIWTMDEEFEELIFFHNYLLANTFLPETQLWKLFSTFQRLEACKSFRFVRSGPKGMLSRVRMNDKKSSLNIVLKGSITIKKYNEDLESNYDSSFRQYYENGEESKKQDKNEIKEDNEDLASTKTCSFPFLNSIKKEGEATIQLNGIFGDLFIGEGLIDILEKNEKYEKGILEKKQKKLQQDKVKLKAAEIIKKSHSIKNDNSETSNSKLLEKESNFNDESSLREVRNKSQHFFLEKDQDYILIYEPNTEIISLTNTSIRHILLQIQRYYEQTIILKELGLSKLLKMSTKGKTRRGSTLNSIYSSSSVNPPAAYHNMDFAFEQEFENKPLSSSSLSLRSMASTLFPEDLNDEDNESLGSKGLNQQRSQHTFFAGEKNTQLPFGVIHNSAIKVTKYGAGALIVKGGSYKETNEVKIIIQGTCRLAVNPNKNLDFLHQSKSITSTGTTRRSTAINYNNNSFGSAARSDPPAALNPNNRLRTSTLSLVAFLPRANKRLSSSFPENKNLYSKAFPMRTPILIQESGYETDLNIRTVSRLGQKALIGDIPVILGGCHPASVISETEVVVFVIKKEDFLSAFDGPQREIFARYKDSAEAKLQRIKSHLSMLKDEGLLIPEKVLQRKANKSQELEGLIDECNNMNDVFDLLMSTTMNE